MIQLPLHDPEFEVQTEDLFKAINDLIREGTVRRITVMRNDRVLLDIPLVAGMAAKRPGQ